jgi:HEAT repeat protein
MSTEAILEELRVCDVAARRERLCELADHPTAEHIDVLICCLRDDNSGVQQTAVEALIRIGSEAVVERLLQLLRDIPSIRNMAVEILNQIITRGIEPTLLALRSPDPNIRKFVIDIFARQSDPRVVEPLIQSIEDTDPNVRSAAAEALGQLRVREAVPALGRLLHDEEWVVFSAITALKTIGDPAALTLLEPLIEQPVESIQFAAIEAVGVLDLTGKYMETLIRLADTAPSELAPVIIKSLVAITDHGPSDMWSQLHRPRWLLMLEHTLKEEDGEFQLAALRGFGYLKDARGARLILNWCRDIAPLEDERIEAIVEALAGMGDSAILLHTLRPEEGNEPLATILVRTLGRMKCPEAVPALIGVRMTHPNWDIRRDAVIALAEIGTEEAVQGLRHSVDDATGYVRCEAIRRLAGLGRPSDATWLLHRLEEERYHDVRDLLVTTLAESAPHDIVGHMPRLLQSPKPELRAAAIRLLGLLKHPEGMNEMRHACNDPEWTVRQSVMEALGQYTNAQAEHELLLGLADDHEKVRLSAVVSLANCGTAKAWSALIAHALQDPDLWVRYRAIERLGHCRVEDALPHLEIIGQSTCEPELIRRAAEEALCAVRQKGER